NQNVVQQLQATAISLSDQPTACLETAVENSKQKSIPVWEHLLGAFELNTSPPTATIPCGTSTAAPPRARLHQMAKGHV
ncbi:hypothetical protein COCVIDRAFT_116643, partial [Bipolaris victoriae FI3]